MRTFDFDTAGALRPLTQRDIEHRIARMVAGLGLHLGSGAADRPCPIAPRELVERIRPFLCQN